MFFYPSNPSYLYWVLTAVSKHKWDSSREETWKNTKKNPAILSTVTAAVWGEPNYACFVLIAALVGADSFSAVFM